MIQLELKPESEQRIEQQVASGNFSTPGQVVDTALLLLEGIRPLNKPTQSEIATGVEHEIASLESGPDQSSEAVQPSDSVNIQSDSGGGQLSLFGLEPVETGIQKPAPQLWLAPKTPELSEKQILEKRSLLAAIAESRLGTIEQQVAFILQRFPETRDNGTAFLIKYWTRFQADILEQWNHPDLNILLDLANVETLLRMRRHIQNTLHMYGASDYIRKLKESSQAEFGEYLSAHQNTDPEIRFYFDETGNEGDNKTYKGVAGICVIEWNQYEKHWASMKLWRDRQRWLKTIRFADLDSASQPIAIQLMSQLQSRRNGLLFVGYQILSRGNTHQHLVSLFIQLVRDSLRHLENLNCLTGPKSIYVVKEAAEGFDRIWLDGFRRDLAWHLAVDFPDRISLKGVEAIPKGREVFLECADLVAGAMQRRALHGGRNPKDVLAEAIFNVTGFEDQDDNGTVFRAFLP